MAVRITPYDIELLTACLYDYSGGEGNVLYTLQPDGSHRYVRYINAPNEPYLPVSATQRARRLVAAGYIEHHVAHDELTGDVVLTNKGRRALYDHHRAENA